MSPASSKSSAALRRASSRRTSSSRVAADASQADAQPIYLRVATSLRKAIVEGQYPVGSRLPTEQEMVADLGISRFTAREAVRVLSAAGLVTRKPRVGTVVVALPDEARYTHDASSVQDLFQYATDTQLRLLYVGKLALGKAQARQFGVEFGGAEWTYAVGVRVAQRGEDEAGVTAARPICLTRLYLNPVLKGIEAKLRERKSAVYALIEREYGESILRVEQELQGAVLGADDAANLGAEPGAPALRIIRRYYDAHGRLLELADNIHPSDRFSYRMTLRK